MFGFLFSRATLEQALSNPFFLVFVVFWVWMFVDAIRQQEWIWALFVGLFLPSAIFYYFLVYRPSRAAGTAPTFELPGSSDRKRIRELEDQIHHLDKAHHHAELGEIYLRQGKLEQASQCFEAAMERDSEDLDILGLTGKCYLKQNRLEDAKKLLEGVVAADVRHDYGQTQMTLGEVYSQLGDWDRAIAAWQSVLEANTYAQARVCLGEAYLVQGQNEAARDQFREVIRDNDHAPDFHRRKDRYWVRRARQLLGKVGEE